MENKLALQSLPLNEVMTMAKTFAESGMFTDAKQTAQAFVKIIAGQEIGIPPFASLSGIHIVQGKPTIGAGLIASCIKGSGKYDYKVVQLDDKACSLDFFQAKDKLGNSTFTIEDAKKAQTKNLDKFPKNMLFARAISNGVKWFCPDVFSGPVYTPEEMQTEDIPHVVIPSNDDPVIEYEQNLREQGSIEDLAEYFKSMPKDKQKEFAKLTGELKAAFEAESVDAEFIELPLISDKDFKALLSRYKTEGMNTLSEARNHFSFTPLHEEAINKVIVEVKKAA